VIVDEKRDLVVRFAGTCLVLFSFFAIVYFIYSGDEGGHFFKSDSIIDANSVESLKESLAKFKDGSESSSTAQLDSVLGELEFLGPHDKPAIHSEVLEWMDGRSIDEIVENVDFLVQISSKADSIEYNSLYKRVELSDEYWRLRDMVEVEYSTKEEKGFGDNYVVIDFKLKNMGEKEISVISGKYSIQGVNNGGKTMTVARDQLFYEEIQGGLAPGEWHYCSRSPDVSAYYTRRFDFNDGIVRLRFFLARGTNGELIFDRNSALDSYETRRLEYLAERVDCETSE
jgi:hypothetical protein